MNYFELFPILEKMLGTAHHISDLNFTVGKLPQVEISGKLVEVNVPGLGKLSPFHTETIALALLGEDVHAMENLLKNGSADLGYSLNEKINFRVSIFSRRGGTYSIVMRVIPGEIPTLESLGVPASLADITELKNGIVLVTGPTGSGKSSTLAAIIDRINREKHYHIIMIEDPIEFIHPHRKSTINQRELPHDTPTFALALRAALRQAPKVILVGEMRDVETIDVALEAAETGHLVLSTLHTTDASKTIDRIVGVYGRNEERAIRTRFSQAFKYIIAQRLIPRADGQGRAAAVEILKSTARTREYIQNGEKEGKTLLDAMNDGQLEGMQSFDGVLEDMIRQGTISATVGLAYATNRDNLMLRLSGLGSSSDFMPQDGYEPMQSDLRRNYGS